MKRGKELNNDEFNKIVVLDGKLIFYDKSPLSMVAEPKDAIFFALHWDQPKIINTTGTAYACCFNTNINRFKFYLWSIYRSSNEEGSKIIIDDVKKNKFSYHYNEDLPQILKDQAPPWVNEKISQIKRCKN